MKNVKLVLWVLVVLALAATACSLGGKPSENGSSSGSGESAPPPAKTPAPDEPAPSTSGGGDQEQALNLSSLTQGLDGLKTYKSVFTFRFTGKDEQGKPVNASMEAREEYTQEPKAQRLSLTSTGLDTTAATGQSNLEMIQIGPTSYLVMQDSQGKSQCIATSADSTSQLEKGMLTPDMLGSVSNADYVKTETIAGIKTKHYVWKTGGLAGLGFTTGKGDVWVAVDGNYVVKYTAEATGKGTLFGTGGSEGTINVEYTLSEVNGSFEIQAPAGCETAAADVPVMKDAQDKSMFGGLVSYTTPSAFQDVVRFYKDEMPKAGWEPSGEPTEMEGLSILEFTKGDQKAQVMISADKDKGTVSVTVTTGKKEG